MYLPYSLPPMSARFPHRQYGFRVSSKDFEHVPPNEPGMTRLHWTSRRNE